MGSVAPSGSPDGAPFGQRLPAAFDGATIVKAIVHEDQWGRGFGPSPTDALHRLRGLLVALAPIMLCLTVLAGQAGAEQIDGPVPSDPGNPFNPKIDVLADDQRAGVNPDLSIRLFKPRNHCIEREPWYTYGCPQDYDTPGQDNAYEEQDFKKLAFSLPAGIAADPEAAPPCTPEFGYHGYSFLDWACAPPVPPRVGVVRGLYLGNSCFAYEKASCGGFPSAETVVSADIYMAERRPGEQAHLVAIGGLRQVESDTLIAPFELVHVSVTVGPSGKITAVADDLPDQATGILRTTGEPGLWVGAPYYDATFTLFGDLGADRGKPFVSNPTSCHPRNAVADVQGYAYNTYADAELNFEPAPGFGEGKTVAGLAAPYNATGCNSLPYAPTFDFKLDPPTPGAAPAVSSTITQDDGEMTTGKVVVRFPKGFRVNFDTKLGQCSNESFEQRSCPADSQIGEATADSRLLPSDSGPLNGKVYLGPTNFEQGNISIFMDLSNDFLPGGIRLKGNSRLEGDGTIVATFDEVPELPIRSFKLDLFGGKDKSLLLNPKSCGQKNVTATFTSHQGRELERTPPVAIACDKPSFDVEMGTRRPGAHPTISLSALGTGVRSATFTLSRYLKRRNPKQLTTGRSYGQASFGGAAQSDGSLRLMRGNRKGSYFFGTARGSNQVASAQVYQRTTATTGDRKRRSKGGRQSLTRLAMRDLPEGTTGVTLELFGKRDGLIKNPSRCKFRRKGRGRVKLNFRATVTDAAGAVHTLSKAIPMRCGGDRR